LWNANIVRAGIPSERELTVIIEGQLPVSLANAHGLIEALADDIERSLDGFKPPAAALPMKFSETVFLEKPDGLPVMACQSMFETGFRR
jgi:hypothetical protein